MMSDYSIDELTHKFNSGIHTQIDDIDMLRLLNAHAVDELFGHNKDIGVLEDFWEHFTIIEEYQTIYDGITMVIRHIETDMHYKQTIEFDSHDVCINSDYITWKHVTPHTRLITEYI